MGSPLTHLVDGFTAMPMACLVLGFFMYLIGLTSYRLFFSQLAAFPGPRLAAATSWYEFFYDVLSKGKYLFEIEKMHRAYGALPQVTHTGDGQKAILIETQAQSSESTPTNYPSMILRLGT